MLRLQDEAGSASSIEADPALKGLGYVAAQATSSSSNVIFVLLTGEAGFDNVTIRSTPQASGFFPRFRVATTPPSGCLGTSASSPNSQTLWAALLGMQ